VAGPQLVGSLSGESEERVRQVFEEAAKNAPSLLFIDGIDVIAGKKEVIHCGPKVSQLSKVALTLLFVLQSSQRGMDRRIIAQLCDSMDMIASLNDPSNGTEEELGASEPQTPDSKTVIVIAATNK
jgi:SpoVK/Ycf46/Vps4 family AAA+-type ATPase